MSDVTPQTSPEILKDVSADRSADSDAAAGESTRFALPAACGRWGLEAG